VTSYEEEVLEVLTRARSELSADDYLDLLQQIATNVEDYIEEEEEE
jgi:hypothetical protein